MSEVRTIVALSGGLDSAVLLADLVKSSASNSVMAIHFHYDSDHNWKQSSAAFQLAEDYKVQLLSIDCGQMIPDDQLKKFSCRNLIFAGVLAAYAEKLEATKIALAIHQDERAMRPDSKPEFSVYLDSAIREATRGRVKLYTPFMDWNKGQVVQYGFELKVPFELTWNCSEGNLRPCGRCLSCVARREAFVKNKATDPI